jgi:hypothetical protein
MPGFSDIPGVFSAHGIDSGRELASVLHGDHAEHRYKRLCGDLVTNSI